MPKSGRLLVEEINHTPHIVGKFFFLKIIDPRISACCHAHNICQKETLCHPCLLRSFNKKKQGRL
jgi:hypothetical protein